MSAGVFTFLATLAYFALIGLMVLLGVIGHHFFGEVGSVIGVVIGAFILTWAACWSIAAA